ncbi:MAG: Beta-phosphoglucomutase [Candidatus Jorgensenbacteria bacterium GW2011_GWA1_48_11]|uniref:Beta-phosphoglucomutase n=1 Tax=Candidatus Jorgensenbacteria bacterium GW2011_GWA1_48_11 TaxID=1618660 RepID=A0A0G1X9U7_9BACT|nr:MAG: Beta-phosphoglucomutase [Candidatus Jorgensenbacteria bacterium GW2011_GWA1_48_11]KKW11779.1 MAG: Beta-phosphoglucomutase [Candidatus Jorgensenbacteria bacterium GW2011_GWB1_49_9]
MKKGAIFDLDGTLVSTIGLHDKAWETLFKRYGIELTKQEFKEQSGRKNTIFIDLVAARRKLDLNAAKLSDEKDEIVMEMLKAKPPAIFEDVEEFLNLLKQKGVKLALATSATSKTAPLLAHGIVSLFDEKIFAEDVSHGKPDPEIFLKAAEKLELKSEDCIVFEDAESGIEAAKRGGFYCVAKDNNLGQNLSEADLVVKNYIPKELIKLFQ